MTTECTHSNWRVRSTSWRPTSYGGVHQDFVTFNVVCECGQRGELNRIVQELTDEYSTVWWGESPGLQIVFTDARSQPPEP